ncbi:MAG: EAL domain-containing protein [Gammaproteobacteria bacterium]
MSLDKSLRRIFLFILASSLVSAAAMLHLKWKDIKQEAFTKLEYTNNLIQTSMESVLKHQETVLTVLGKRLKELVNTGEHAKAKKLIDEMLIQNPGLVGFGLTDIKGNYILISSNLETMALPNLLKQPESAASFKKTLASNNMVMGRTYFFKPSGNWVIPARLRVTDEHGNAIAVMTTAFIYNSEHSPWNDVVLPKSVRLLIAKQDGEKFYRQYLSGISVNDLHKWINEPVEAHATQTLLSDLYEQKQVTLEEFLSSEKLFKINTTDKNKVKQILTLQYDEKYELFTLVMQPEETLYSSLTPAVLWLSIIIVAFNLALYVMLHLISKIQARSKAILEFRANHDVLTELPNRHYLNTLGDNWIANNSEKAALLFVDLKHFKSTNDFYGHRIGDALLKVVAQRLLQNFPNDIVIRLGGAEFVVILLGYVENEIEGIIQSVLTNLQKTTKINAINFNLNVCIGGSRYPKDGNDIDELLRKADIAMYEAKQRSQPFLLYADELEEKTRRKKAIEKEIPNALANNEFSLVYQPQIDARSRKLTGVETLIRWHSDKLGFVPPDEFISIAETSGTIKEIGRFVLEQSLLEMNEICDKNIKADKKSIFYEERLRLAINVSVQQLLHDDFSRFVADTLDRHGNRLVNLMIEITESLFIDDIQQAKNLLQAFKKMGVMISLDDFGTGYSSLSILNQLPIDELKIDKSFVHGILKDRQARNLIKSVISIGRDLSIEVLAEGIEEEAEADLLSEFGCDVFQGYCFSKPLNKEQLISFIDSYEI